jgi:hypothetical protein
VGRLDDAAVTEGAAADATMFVNFFQELRTAGVPVTLRWLTPA